MYIVSNRFGIRSYMNKFFLVMCFYACIKMRKSDKMKSKEGKVFL